MKAEREILHSRVPLAEYSRISHMIFLADFNTNYPSANRIDRIANEINEYLKYKNENAKI